MKHKSFILILVNMKSIIIILILIISNYSISQNEQCERVLFSGTITDTLRPQSFYNLMVINKTTGQGVFGNANGSFSVYTKYGDTIALSVKGYPVIERVMITNDNCQFKESFYLEAKVQEIEEVVIHPLKSLSEIKQERQNLAMRETRQVTGLEVLQSPITALYQAFSKKEKAKRWIAEQELLDQQRDILKQLLRNYVAYDIIDLNEKEFDEFILFLNMDESFLKTATEMELITFLKDKYEHYIKNK